MERLGDLTREIQRRKFAEAIPYFWLLCKHVGDLPGALAAAPRFNATSPSTERVLKAAVAAGTTSNSGWASELSYYHGLFSEFVQAISAETLIGKIDAVPAPFFTKTIGVTAAPSGAWVAPGDSIPFSRATLATTDALPEKKCATLVAFSDESIRTWSPTVARNMQQMIARAVKYTVDQTLLDPAADATAARPASLTNGIATSQSTGSTAAQCTADLKALLAALIDGGWPIDRFVFIMSPSTWLHLSQLLTTGGTYAFPDLAGPNRHIWGIKTLVSPAASLVGSPSNNIVAVVDGARIQVADDGLMLADASSASSLQFTDAPTDPANQISLFQTHGTVLRIQRVMNFQRIVDSGAAWFNAGY